MSNLLPLPYMAGHYASGQPSREQLQAFAREGVRTVINLRAPSEPVEFDEAAAVQRERMRYVALPVAGADDLDREKVRQFGHALDQARALGPVLVHCASSNRVGALVALDEALNRGATPGDALARGRSAGLASLEPAVVALIERERTGPSA